MKCSLKKGYLSAMGNFALTGAILLVSGSYLYGQELADLHPIPAPATPVISTAAPSHSHTPAVYTDWLPSRVVWSNNLLRAVAKECSSFVAKYDVRFKISKEDPRDYGSCVVQLYDAVGALRATENWNPGFHPKSRRGQNLKIYMAHEYGTRRFGVYELSELAHGIDVTR